MSATSPKPKFANMSPRQIVLYLQGGHLNYFKRQLKFGWPFLVGMGVYFLGILKLDSLITDETRKNSTYWQRRQWWLDYKEKQKKGHVEAH